MNTLKLIAISCSIILILILLFGICYLLTKKFKARINTDGKVKLSFSIWFGAIFLAGANIVNLTLNMVFEIIDNLIKIQSNDFSLELIKGIFSVIGVGFVWFLLWFFVVKFLTKFLPFELNEIEEMEEDNYGYFIIKGVIFLSIIFSLSPVLSLLLRTFIPNIQIPFYH